MVGEPAFPVEGAGWQIPPVAGDGRAQLSRIVGFRGELDALGRPILHDLANRMTMTRSHNRRTTLRSCETNR